MRGMTRLHPVPDRDQPGSIQQVESPTRSRAKVTIDLAMLYASKSGAVLVGVLILPQFTRLLGAEQFGVVAVIFSFQALLLILDLGMSTLLSRDIAASENSESSTAWRTGEAVVSLFYVVLTPVVLLLSCFVRTGLSSIQLLMAMLLFWVLTVQNIGQTALMAKHHFAAAGSIQFVGVAVRGIATLLALRFIAADLTVFLLSQLFCATGQAVVTRYGCSLFLPSTSAKGKRVRRIQCLQMTKRGLPLVLFGIAGAAVTQLDKPIITAFMSAAQIAPYYLATILCLTPLSLLAGPVAQYFQPRLVRAVAANDDALAQQVLRPFTAAIVAVTVLPSAFLWAMREPIALAWLGNSLLVGDVVQYTAILLPGVVFGALGFVPYGILLARQDYRFQAVTSAILTVVTLLGTIACARAQSVQGVCWVYAAYHTASTLISWARCIQRQQNGARYAKAAALRTTVMGGLAAASVVTAIVVGQRYF